MRERVEIWEIREERVKRRRPWELYELIAAAINRRTDREISEMAFKGAKRPDKGKDGGDKILEQYRELVRIQSEVIHALAAALATTEVEGEEGEEDEEEDENKDKDEE